MSVFDKTPKTRSGANSRLSDSRLAPPHSLAWENIGQPNALGTFLLASIGSADSAGTHSTVIHGNQTEVVAGARNVYIDDTDTEQYGADRDLTILGNENDLICGNDTETIMGCETYTCVGAENNCNSIVNNTQTVNSFQWTPVSATADGFAFFICPLYTSIYGIYFQGSMMSIGLNALLSLNVSLVSLEAESVTLHEKLVHMTDKLVDMAVSGIKARIGAVEVMELPVLNAAPELHGDTPVS